VNRFPLLFALAVLLCGCVHKPQPMQKQDGRVLQLAQMLAEIAPQAGEQERLLLAQAAISSTLHQAEEYRPIAQPHLNNILINLGLRKRGLCYHWSDDLQSALAALPLPSFEFVPAVTHRGSLFEEHSALVVIGRGARFEEGILLDGWRNGGELYWSRVSQDIYRWSPWRTVAADDAAAIP